MILDLTKLLSAGNGQEKYTSTFDMPEVAHYGESFPVKKTEAFELTVTNESGKSLTVTGKTKVTLSIPCDRCLKEVAVIFPIEIDEAFVIEDEQIVTDADENEDLADKKSVEEGQRVDHGGRRNRTEKILCRADCKGLCPVCGHDLNEGDCGCNKTVLDPRMAQFLDVFNGSKK